MTIIKHDFQSKKQRDGTVDTENKKIPGFQLRIELSYSSPLIWRTVNVPGTLTLADFHRIIQICFDWDDTATHRFLIGKIFYSPAKTDISEVTRSEIDIQLHELEKDMSFIFSYLYDGGCGWECEVTLEHLFPDTKDIPYPVLVRSDRACPPACIEDIHEYQDFLSRLEKAGEAQGKILSEYRLSSSFNPAFCDIHSINKRLKLVSCHA